MRSVEGHGDCIDDLLVRCRQLLTDGAPNQDEAIDEVVHLRTGDTDKGIRRNTSHRKNTCMACAAFGLERINTG